MRFSTYNGHANAQTELDPTHPPRRRSLPASMMAVPRTADDDEEKVLAPATKRIRRTHPKSLSTNPKKMRKQSRLKISSLLEGMLVLLQHQHCAHAFTLSHGSSLASPTTKAAKYYSLVDSRPGLWAHKIDSKGGLGKAPSSNAAEGKERPGWRRRVFSRLRRNKQHHHHNMVATVTDEARPAAASLDQFVLDNFEKLSPEQLFSTLEQQGYSLDGHDTHHQHRANNANALSTTVVPELPLEEEITTTLSEAAESNLLLQTGVAKSIIGATSSFEGGPPVTKVVRKWFQNLLVNTFTRWAVAPPVNLRVLCSPMGNVFWSIVRGQLNCNVRMDFDRIAFEPIQLSGGSIEGSELALNLLAFTVDHSKEFNTNNTSNTSSSTDQDAKHTTPIQAPKSASKSKDAAKATNDKTKVKTTSKDGKRYQTQFDLHANDCVLTQEDLFASKCVRNGLRNLLIRILKGRNIHPSVVDITSIEILDNGKISCKGEAFMKGTMGTTRVPFEVRSSIDFKSRGHVLSFPGLEISLSPDLMGLFVPVVPTIELDVGHNARLREIQIDGTNKLVQLAASVTITPLHTLKVGEKYSQSKRSYSARFSYDVGRWLTRIGRFSL